MRGGFLPAGAVGRCGTALSLSDTIYRDKTAWKSCVWWFFCSGVCCEVWRPGLIVHVNLEFDAEKTDTNLHPQLFFVLILCHVLILIVVRFTAAVHFVLLGFGLQSYNIKYNSLGNSQYSRGSQSRGIALSGGR